MTIILGIETSCDETSAAVVNEEKKILSNIVFSQLDEHRPYGGVVPEIAARAHITKLPAIIDQAMEEAGISFQELDAVAVTGGPGLIGGVIVGVMMAKTIASVHDKPFIAVNHLEGHALTARLTDNVAFPYLLLLVSGGHCQLLTVHGVGQYTKLGGTIDDALGEAYDKTAKMMGLAYPGGPKIEQLAKKGDGTCFTFPRPLKGKEGCDMSFSGLKTAVRQAIDSVEMNEQNMADIAASFQEAVADVLEEKVAKAMEQAKVETLVVAGGVAANQFLRGKLEILAGQHNMQLIAPPIKLCTDNAAMIAWGGMEHFQLGNINLLTFAPKARWPL